MYTFATAFAFMATIALAAAEAEKRDLRVGAVGEDDGATESE